MISTATLLTSWSALTKKHIVTRTIVLDERGTHTALVVLAVTFLALGFIYIYALNSLAAIGYQVKDLEEQRAVLENSTEKLHVQVAQAQSTGELMKKIEVLEMVPANKVSFIEGGASTVAVK